MMLLLLLGWQETIKIWVGLHAAVCAHSMTV